ncbi:hypothetical protein K8R47_03580 [archaeon]|nr:hypothetical protein [archaeon]
MDSWKVILGLLIIVLVWVSSDVWSKILITIAALMFVFPGCTCCTPAKKAPVKRKVKRKKRK